MKCRFLTLCILALGIAVTVYFFCCSKDDRMNYTTLFKQAHTIGDVQKLFNQTAQSLAENTQEYIHLAQKHIDEIIAIPDDKRTFENTFGAFDELCSIDNFEILASIASILENASPDEAVRTAAHEAQQNLQEFSIKEISTNKKLYQALKAYADARENHDHLNDENRYFMSEVMSDYKRNGLNLPDAELELVRSIKKDLADLALQFEKNIATDNRTIQASASELIGVSEGVLGSLKKDTSENYILGMDYPTVTAVLRDCTIEKTRERIYHAFNNRGYPANKEVLEKIIALRDQLAKALGFASFAHLDLDDQMVQSPERAYEFINTLLDRSLTKEEQEIKEWTSELPTGVTLTAEGKVKPWDMAYVVNEYKKKHFDLNEEALSEYFPMEHTIAQLLDIYRQFFSIEFEQENGTGFWHPDVQLINVYSKDRSQLLGRLLLDLFPRENKFSHAAVFGFLPAIKKSGVPAVAVMMANFPKGSADKPSLWKRGDVQTFFHEFGHALHQFLGKTELGSFAGTRTKRDFVELPSQILEEWLTDKAILKKVSSHYKTREPLSDEVIEKILALKTFDSGFFVKRQLFFSLIALDYFGAGEHKEAHALWISLMKKLANPLVMVDESVHGYASFGHLTGYAAKYYGYLWSRVFAFDLFETIKEQGLLDPVVGQRYVVEVLGRGGSKDPNEMLVAFLGRQPSSEAFFKNMAL